MKVFLSADWKNLINLTYEINPSLLEEYLPKGVEIDIVNGKAHVSLVAFDFLNTKVKGVKLPFHVNFPEINLRFYVRYKGQVGVVFIKEFVPRQCIAFVANRFYNEPYFYAKMKSETKILPDNSFLQSHFINLNDNHFSVSVKAKNQAISHEESSFEHYFKEHSWGFGKSKTGRIMCYYVEHEIWETYPVEEFKIDIDFPILYGKKWEFLNGAIPKYRAIAEGSKVKVFNPISLEEMEKIIF